MTLIGFNTGVDGWYTEPNIRGEGWYDLTANAEGYKPVTKRVFVKDGQTALLDFTLDAER